MQCVDVLVCLDFITLVREPQTCDFANVWPWDVSDTAEKDWVDDERVA
jgi:hypothetical protein